MVITEEMIRELQNEVDISYEEAEKFLRQAKGNIEIAKRHAKKKQNSFWNRLFKEFEKIVNATLVYRLRIYKKDDDFVNVPIIIFIVILVIGELEKTLFLGVIFVIWALLADCNLQLNKVDRKEDFKFYRTVSKSKTNKPNINKPTNNYNKPVLEEIIETQETQELENQELKLQELESQELEPQKLEPVDIEIMGDTPHSGEYHDDDDDDDDYYEVTIDK